MKARLVRIGHSRGVRLPKVLIEEAGLTGDVDLQVRDGRIIISPARLPREGWAEAAAALGAASEGGLLDAPTSTRFDREEWKW
jgi:antitoxin MazE